MSNILYAFWRTHLANGAMPWSKLHRTADGNKTLCKIAIHGLEGRVGIRTPKREPKVHTLAICKLCARRASKAEGRKAA